MIFKEIEHNATWVIRIHAYDLCELLINAVRGMSHLLVVNCGVRLLTTQFSQTEITP